VVDQLEPGLAASWEINPDGLTHTFAIQPGIAWQNVAPLNGRPFTATDAAFSLTRSSAEGVHRQYFTNVDTIVAVDDATLTIKLKQPQPDFIYPLAGPYTGIYPRELVDDGTISTRAIGTGPVVLESWSAPVGGDFVRNPDYWRGPIHIERFEDRSVRDQSAALAMQRSGQVDYGWWVTTEQDFEAVLSTNPDTQYRTSPIFGGGFVIAMNLDLPKWADERVRRALSLAVDRETIKNVIYGALGRVAALPDWQFFWDEEPTQESGRLGNWWRYEPDEARALLAAAGVSDFSFDLLYSPGYNNMSTIELLIDQLRNSGITMRSRSVEGTEFNLQWTARKGEADSFDGWSAAGSTAEHYVFGLHHSKSPGNRYRINDPQIDTWAEQHQVELDPDTRRELAQHVWERVHDQVYYVTRAIGFSIQLLQPHVRGLNSWSGRIGTGGSYIDTANNLRGAWLDA
jgi:peptide/nickel transport system substrate-binding protein